MPSVIEHGDKPIEVYMVSIGNDDRDISLKFGHKITRQIQI